ncbi:hypothetical protein ACQBAU_06025 [Propionibacteriaceae bacterium Y2011]|uniref:hypothetical protein n=1 Tax=Microlunatus sp. Y2014 TaxID=3418488 RepID=UPI003B4CA7BA
MQQKYRRAGRVLLWLLRVLCTLWLIQLLYQIILAGGFISGQVEWFQGHSLNGAMLGILPFFGVVAAVVHLVLVRRRWWLIPLWLGMWLLIEVQAILGYTRVIGAHIVGGSVLLATAAILCVALWRMAPLARQVAA